MLRFHIEYSDGELCHPESLCHSDSKTWMVSSSMTYSSTY